MFGRPEFCKTCYGSQFRLSQSGTYRRLKANIFLYRFRCLNCGKLVSRFSLRPAPRPVSYDCPEFSTVGENSSFRTTLKYVTAAVFGS